MKAWTQQMSYWYYGTDYACTKKPEIIIREYLCHILLMLLLPVLSYWECFSF